MANSLLDTDIIQKIGGFRGVPLLKKILLSFDYQLFVHSYIVNEELILDGPARSQFNEILDS